MPSSRKRGDARPRHHRHREVLRKGARSVSAVRTSANAGLQLAEQDFCSGPSAARPGLRRSRWSLRARLFLRNELSRVSRATQLLQPEQHSERALELAIEVDLVPAELLHSSAS